MIYGFKGGHVQDDFFVGSCDFLERRFQEIAEPEEIVPTT